LVQYNQKERENNDITSSFYEKYTTLFLLAPIEEIKNQLGNIFQNLEKYDSLIIDLKYSSDYLKNILSGRSLEDIKNASISTPGIELAINSNLPSDPDIINIKLEELDKELNNIKDAISDTNIRIASNFKSQREENEILTDIDETTNYIKEYEHQYECMKIAKSVLRESFNEIQENFGPKLNERASSILNKIKPDSPVEIKVSRDFYITLNLKHGLMPYEIDYFSYGAQDQAYFALRMAISDILSSDFKGFPLLMDDPFTQYDEPKMHNVIDFIAETAKERQVFIFTCHKNVADYSKANGGTCYELNT